MRCIFCKSDSSDSRSIEHIIPEALGNTDHTLPRGVVCDKCNNYFTRKLEGPLLASTWFRHARARQQVPSKRGLIPPFTAIVPAARVAANVWLDGSNMSFGAIKASEESQLFDALRSGRAHSLYIPDVEHIDQRLMARLLAKMAVEIVCLKMMATNGWEKQIVDEHQLDNAHSGEGDHGFRRMATT